MGMHSLLLHVFTPTSHTPHPLLIPALPSPTHWQSRTPSLPLARADPVKVALQAQARAAPAGVPRDKVGDRDAVDLGQLAARRVGAARVVALAPGRHARQHRSRRTTRRGGRKGGARRRRAGLGGGRGRHDAVVLVRVEVAGAGYGGVLRKGGGGRLAGDHNDGSGGVEGGNGVRAYPLAELSVGNVPGGGDEQAQRPAVVLDPDVAVGHGVGVVGSGRLGAARVRLGAHAGGDGGEAEGEGLLDGNHCGGVVGMW